jgi:hypothetical protein
MEDWQGTFTTLLSFRNEFREEVLTAVFWWALKMKPEYAVEVEGRIARTKNPKNIKFTDFTWAIDHISHVVGEESLNEFFTDKKAAKKFRSLINVKALEDEVARAGEVETLGTTPLQFIPQRNLLTEFSGHIGDACWANIYPSILKEFPNFTSVTIVSNPEDPKTRRLAGSFFLIETETESGERLLVIRGLNPIENLINQLDPEDFLDSVEEYLQPIAAKMGRQLAIVIDDYAGGSGTNRPVLFSHMFNDRRDQKNLVKGIKRIETDFNDYDVSKDIYRLGLTKVATSS